VCPADLEILLAMVGGDVNQARALVSGDEVPGKKRPGQRKIAAAIVHRVACNRPGELGALPFGIIANAANGRHSIATLMRSRRKTV
jgi:hypothetical protein